MTNIEKLDYVFEQLKVKHGEEFALKNIEEYLKTGNIKLITRHNNAREIITDIKYVDIFEILSKYALLSFIRNNKKVSLTEEEVNVNVNDLDGNIEFTLSKAVETLVLINAINPFYGYTGIAVSKNLKNKVIQSLVLERYKFNIKDDFNKEIAKFITIKRNNEDKKYITSLERIGRCVSVIKEEEQLEYEKTK